MNMRSINAPDRFCEQCHTRHYCVASRLQDHQLTELGEVMQLGQRIAAGEHLFACGDIVTAQFHVRTGMFKSYSINRQGDEFVTGFYLPGDVVPIFESEGRSIHSVVALEEASVCKVAQGCEQGSRQVWQALGAQAHAMANDALMHQLNVKATSAQARFAGFCTHMMQRLDNLGRDSTHIPTPMSRTDIASYLGLTLESLSRVMSRMKQSGVISADRNQIHILEPDTLRTLAIHLS